MVGMGMATWSHEEEEEKVMLGKGVGHGEESVE